MPSTGVPSGNPEPGPRRRRLRILLALVVVALAVLLVVLASRIGDVIRDGAETTRTTARFDPPVWAGQNVPGACSGGFYARSGSTVVLTIVAHCATPGTELRDPAGRLIGVFGPRAELTDCPVGRFCAPSDFLPLALAAEWIPWGHLNIVDLGAGGYRTFGADTTALACSGIAVGASVETNGREHYRSGAVSAVGAYAHETDTIFPCMVVTDVGVVTGDSGAAVLVDGAPAGVVSRRIGDRMAFTPLAEGLENLRLVLCVTPDCDLTPSTAIQPRS